MALDAAVGCEGPLVLVASCPFDLAGHPCILHVPHQTGAPGPGSAVAMGRPCPSPSLRLPSRKRSHHTPGRGEGWRSEIKVRPVNGGASQQRVCLLRTPTGTPKL